MAKCRPDLLYQYALKEILFFISEYKCGHNELWCLQGKGRKGRKKWRECRKKERKKEVREGRKEGRERGKKEEREEERKGSQGGRMERRKEGK